MHLRRASITAYVSTAIAAIIARVSLTLDDVESYISNTYLICGCKHVFRFVTNQDVLFIILSKSPYYPNTPDIFVTFRSRRTMFQASIHATDHCDVYSETRGSFYSSRSIMTDAADDTCSASRSPECASYDVQLPNSFYSVSVIYTSSLTP